MDVCYRVREINARFVPAIPGIMTKQILLKGVVDFPLEVNSVLLRPPVPIVSPKTP